MPVALGATARLTILFPKCRPKAPATRTYYATRNCSPRIQSQPRHLTIRRSQQRKKTRKIRKRGSKIRGGSTLVNKPWPLASILRPKRKRSRLDASTIIRKAIMRMIVSNFQKTSVGLGKLRAGD